MITYHHGVANIALGVVSRESCSVSALRGCTPLPKAAKWVRTKQLTRLPCLVVYVKFQFRYKDSIASNRGNKADLCEVWNENAQVIFDLAGILSEVLDKDLNQ